jgi:hypothetical protein
VLASRELSPLYQSEELVSATLTKCRPTLQNVRLVKTMTDPSDCPDHRIVSVAKQQTSRSIKKSRCVSTGPHEDSFAAGRKDALACRLIIDQACLRAN